MRNLNELKLNDKGDPVATPSPTTHQIEVVERLIGRKLPSAYVEFLQFSNGGHPELDTLTLSREGNEYTYSINSFFHIMSDTEWTDDTEDVVWRYRHRWRAAPREVLPIARDGGDNLYCVDLTDEGEGRIVLQIHDEPDAPLILLADTLEGFIDRLQPNPDYV